MEGFLDREGSGGSYRAKRLGLFSSLMLGYSPVLPEPYAKFLNVLCDPGNMAVKSLKAHGTKEALYAGV